WPRDWSSDVCSSDLDDGLSKRLGQQLVGRVGAHPAGIRPLVAIKNAFVVARRHQRRIAAAVGHHDERQLVAFETFLQKDALPARSEERRVGKEGNSR